MRVVITGGGGFLGQCLLRHVLKRGALRAHAKHGEELVKVSSVVLADVARPAQWHFDEHELFGCGRASFEVGDVADAAFVESLLAGADDLSVFHLGAVMSGDGERDFDGCMATNLHGTEAVREPFLDARQRDALPRRASRTH